MENKKPKVLYYQQNPVWGAAEEYLALLIEGLDKDRFQPILMCSKDDSIQPLVEAVKLTAEVHHSEPDGLKGILGTIRQFRRLKPDLIHVNDPALTGLLAGQFVTRGHRVITYHTPELEMTFNWKGKLAWKLAFRPPIHTIALSKRNKETLVTRYGFHQSHVSVIPHGLKEGKFDHKFNRSETRRALGIPQDCTVVINVARLAPQKGAGPKKRISAPFLQVAQDCAGPHTRLLPMGIGMPKEMIESCKGKCSREEIVRHRPPNGASACR